MRRQHAGALLVPSYQGTDSMGTSSCMCFSQSRVSQRFSGLQCVFLSVNLGFAKSFDLFSHVPVENDTAGQACKRKGKL